VRWRRLRRASSLVLAVVLAVGWAGTTAGRSRAREVAEGPWQTPVVPRWRVGRDVPPPPAWVGSAAAVLLDPVSGQVLYEHAGYVRRPPASTTKILTAYIVIRRGDLDRVVTVSRRAAGTVGSRMHIRTGERIAVRALLTGLLMRSGNDAATALAEATDGSVEAFALHMNRVARALGARASHFENPHGLSDPHHYTTAYDLARIARAALSLPTFRALVATPEARVEDADGRVFDMRNTNRLLEVLPGADGVKTGTTDAAGKCLVSSATRGGFALLAVVLRSPDRWGESAALLRWGFRAFAPVAGGARAPLGDLPGGSGVARRPLALAAPLRAVVPARYAAGAHTAVWTPTRLPAGARPGRTVGSAVLQAGGRIVAQVPVVVARGEVSDRH